MVNQEDSFHEIQRPTHRDSFAFPIVIRNSSSRENIPWELNSRHILGPVSVFGPIRWPPLLEPSPNTPQNSIPKETTKKAHEKDETDGHKFLMHNLKIENDEHSLENIEIERSVRSAFLQMMAIATIQDENFQLP
ncbi:CLUMA_CG018325, isoform A [Clunio marinus]|uniref:CLUMA_CG018325, isoform A n=1 Tax=Clunio marinus TaxID=568069 RepID=A0A1J1J0L8_9DIPT|nr:CLUMA_CG018325, isoform A [Clunio marinus]